MLSDDEERVLQCRLLPSFNAPFGARCFLTEGQQAALRGRRRRVLMRLLALGLSDEAAKQRNHLHPEVLMRLLALGAF